MADQKLARPLVSIVIINWNGLSDTSECLDSLGRIDYPNYRTVVVDNASQGKEADIIQQRYGRQVTLMRSDKNLGFTGGCNLGMDYALKTGAGYVLLLNNDTTVDPHFLTAMVDALEADPSAGIAGARIMDYGAGSVQFVWGGFSLWSGQPSYVPRFLTEKVRSAPADRGQYDLARYIRWTTGCCMLIKGSVLKAIGRLEDSYFAYLEDVEYCLRACEKGYKVIYVPSAVIQHKGGRSLQGKGGLAAYLLTRNRFKLMKKHASRVQYACFLAYFLLLYWWIASLYYAAFYRGAGMVSALFHGMQDGLSGRDEHWPLKQA